MSGGWTVVDANTNKSLPITGKNDSNAVSPYFTPAPGQQDPVGKMRVSQPQALIDTDFEYGQQPTKWESIALQNNRQSCYYIPQSPLAVTSITGTTTLTITVATSITIPANNPIYIQNATDSNANGWWYTVAGVTAGTSFTVIPTTAASAGEKYNAALTYVYVGYFYTQCGIQVGANAFTTNGTATVTVATVNPHGLSAGSLVYITNTTSTGTIVNGAMIVATTPAANTFTFTNTNGTVAAAAISNSAGTNVLFARPAGYVESRSFDGGVAFSAGAAVPNSQLIRQTRRYFRYQSGKAIQFSTGTSLCPPLFLTSITSSGTTATVTTRFAHNIAVGCTVQISGADQGPYNGTFTVATVPSPTTFTYTMGSTAASPATGFMVRCVPTNWYGSSNRAGFFDQQNGLFFEYDGQTLYAVWRQSVNQINGTVSVTQGSSSITGTGTQFSTQLVPGDFIVIRGQSYRVLTIANDTSMFVSPEYRGTTISGCLVSKTIDTRVPRSQWLDPLDGSGASGYNLDLTRMQMFYIDYSWYGAGFARWGLRTSKGQITYVYQQTNNNFRYEAYMRSGNLPAHYESNGITPAAVLTSTLASGTGAGGVINVTSTAGFAPSGTLRIQAAGQTGAVEHITYSSRTANSFVITARAQTGGAGTAQTFTFSATAPIIVEFASPDTVASLSHWGSSVIMDGNFNDDKSLVFNYGTTTALSLNAGTTVPVMAIRVAPSVDNGTTGLLGAKEIINRAQLQLADMAAVASGAVLINLVLNGFCTGFSGSFGSIATGSQVTSSLAQVAVNTSNTATITGGESVTALYANGVQQLDLSAVRDLGNSILGGGTTNTIPTSQAGFYPDGPDILYVVATNTTASAVTLLARVNWKEAQA
jgi:hypothetical protein